MYSLQNTDRQQLSLKGNLLDTTFIGRKVWMLYFNDFFVAYSSREKNVNRRSWLQSLLSWTKNLQLLLHRVSRYLPSLSFSCFFFLHWLVKLLSMSFRVHFGCKARLLFKKFGCEARLLFKHFGCKTKLLFKKFGCEARLSSNHYGCKARFLFKHFGAKQDFCSTIWSANQDFCSEKFMCKARLYSKFWVWSKTFVQTFWMQSKNFD